MEIPANIRRTVEAIHGAPQRLVYTFAGAGSLALHWLHAVSGSSRTVLEALDSYAPRSLAGVVGTTAASAVSAETAGAMAAWAIARAGDLAEGDWPLLGVACTAAIATDRARRGADRAFVAVHGLIGETCYALTLREADAYDGRDRAGQEELISRLVLSAIAEACGLEPLPLALLAEERLTRL